MAIHARALRKPPPDVRLRLKSPKIATSLVNDRPYAREATIGFSVPITEAEHLPHVSAMAAVSSPSPPASHFSPLAIYLLKEAQHFADVGAVMASSSTPLAAADVCAGWDFD